ncbi:MAG: Slp family lipoprotein [Deltaproteobacteria bacterium]|nr:Slp family lipoprotein [Deltaproteobacteria bacterium]MBW2046906.1 Slp family lipoprotein [Deltaproteobacteria bacterium]MBW2110951.1 Slp family lipoprotein [Deltaproteobacteria bacterium]MBW2351739.1 Slp family lipoprotein [Deltaproteobacteria bacterium]
MEYQANERQLLWVLLIGALWFGACAKVISPETVKQVNKGITFASLLKNSAAFSGKTVLLGGSIIKTENLADKTLIIMLQRPLDEEMRPMGDDESGGRFIISAPGFLDPAIYREGREITVAGRVAGDLLRTLDKIEYAYPVIDRIELYLWPVEKALDTQPRVSFGIGIGFGF